MTQSVARGVLGEVIDEYGIDGAVRVSSDPDDILGVCWEGADLIIPHDGIQERRDALRDRVYEANHQSWTRPR